MNENFLKCMYLRSTCLYVRFYGGSESLKTRVSASVCQKNDGYKYITEVEELIKVDVHLAFC